MSTPASDNGGAGQRDRSGEDWDITSGVGFTALAVAAGRAMETEGPAPLVRDPHAVRFVDAAGSDGAVLPTAWPPDLAEQAAAAGIDPGELHQLWAGLATYMGVRSRYFDQFFHTACEDMGIRQVVLLAAGLDTRAHRLAWPADTVVFEVDHPNVLAFKDRVLTESNAAPDCARRAVGADLREDWPAALRQAGFDPGQPTAWLAEGLLPYLPDDAKQDLSARVQALSAVGSRWAIESIPDPAVAMRELFQQPVLRRMSAQIGIDPSSLWPPEQHWDPHTWLIQQGWSVTAASAHTVAGRYQRVLGDAALVADQRNPSVLLTAVREHAGQAQAG